MASVPLAPPEENLLRRLWVRGPATAKVARAGVATVAGLVERGLVREVAGATRSAARLELTDSGRARAAALPPAKPTLAFLAAELVRIRERLDELTASGDARHAGPPGGAAPSPARFDEALRAALGDLDRRGRYGGLVPIPEVRRALAGLGLSRAAFDEALLERERAFSVDSKVANDPRTLVDADDGLRDGGRGLLYYVVRR